MNPLDLDIVILRAINGQFSTSVAYFFIAIIYSVYFFLFFLIYYYFSKKQRSKLLHLVLSLFIGYMFVLFLKYSIDRPRPYDVYPNINIILTKADPSFPSAHTFIALLGFCFIPKELPKYIRYLLGFYLIFLIPFGLMYTGVHFPSDVLIGGILGLIFPKIISQKFSEKIFKRLF